MAARVILLHYVFSLLSLANCTHLEPSQSAQRFTETWQLDPFVEMPTSSAAKNGAVTTYSWAVSPIILKKAVSPLIWPPV